jgi:hypothetical protein
MSEPIDLVETSPGEWRFVRLLRIAAGKHFKKDAEARRERFFDSLAGETVRPRQDRWWTGGIAIALIVTAASIFLAIVGRWDIVFLPISIATIFIAITIVIPDLCRGHSLRDVLKSLIRP